LRLCNPFAITLMPLAAAAVGPVAAVTRFGRTSGLQLPERPQFVALTRPSVLAAPVALQDFFDTPSWRRVDFLLSRAGLSNLHQACRGEGAGLSLSSGIKPHASDVSTAD
jgi:hypothetical protein